jgi:hypothetical protein
MSKWITYTSVLHPTGYAETLGHYLLVARMQQHSMNEWYLDILKTTLGTHRSKYPIYIYIYIR